MFVCDDDLVRPTQSRAQLQSGRACAGLCLSGQCCTSLQERLELAHTRGHGPVLVLPVLLRERCLGERISPSGCLGYDAAWDRGAAWDSVPRGMAKGAAWDSHADSDATYRTA
jgi:hypothetical protein